MNATELRLPQAVTICEVGPRDGIQNEAVMLTAQQKASLVNRMADAGCPVIEVGSFMHPKAVPQMATTDEVFSLISKKPDVEYRALIANRKGVERAAACGCDKVKLNVSASRAHNLANLNCTPQQSVEQFSAVADAARACGLALSGSVSMPFGSPWEREIPLDDVYEIVKAYRAVGVFEISLSDTPGVAHPKQVYSVCTKMLQKFPDVTWWLHFHNTRGLGLSNVLAGMQAGITRFDSSFAGVGGCPYVPGAAGNIATEDLLHLCMQMDVRTGIDLDRTLEIARAAAALVGHATDSYLLRAGKASDLIRDLPTGQTTS